jgi:hypothetical protein
LWNTARKGNAGNGSGNHFVNNLVVRMAAPNDDALRVMLGRGLENNIIRGNSFSRDQKFVIDGVQGTSLEDLNDTDDAHDNIIASANFVHTDYSRPNAFELAEGAEQIDKGVALTETVSAGHGRTIKVKHAGFFVDGSGVVSTKYNIQVSDDVAQIDAVNYQTDTITVDEDLDWRAGEPVSQPYFGESPDIGAMESGSDTRDPPDEPPTPLGFPGPEAYPDS